MRSVLVHRANAAYLSVLILISVVLWLPRFRGPLDLRYDAGVYYILGSSLAQGKGYRLLNEPGEIQAIQYPPLLPLFAAAHQLLAGSAHPAVAGHLLRLSFFVLFIALVVAVYLLSRRYLSPGFAFLVALVTLLHVHTTWLSELFFAELPFALTTTLFLLVVGRKEGRLREWLCGLLGIASFLLRSAGIALLAAWVGESLLRLRFREATFRAMLALLPILAWQSYTAHVQSGHEYSQPAYEYQRAGYQYYNVGYLENIAYVDPFVPELGKVSPELLLKRITRNLMQVPVSLGAAVSSSPQWAKSKLEDINEGSEGLRVPLWLVEVPLVLLSVVVLCGLLLMALQSQMIIPLYIAGSIGLTCLTPWHGQFYRYLAPLTPLLALAFFLALVEARERLSTVSSGRWQNASIALIATLALGVFFLESVPLYKIHQKSREVFYEDHRGRRHEYRLFFYTRAWQQHDLALDWLKKEARPWEIISTSTPHWAYLKTGLRAVMPPFEADVYEAQRLVDSVPVSYLIIDTLEFVDIGRRYPAPIVRSFPERWRLIYSTPENGSRIYRRVNPGGSTGSP
jgi:hypothetical protein